MQFRNFQRNLLCSLKTKDIRSPRITTFEVCVPTHIALRMFILHALTSQWHFLTNRNAELVVAPSLWRVNCTEVGDMHRQRIVIWTCSCTILNSQAGVQITRLRFFRGGGGNYICSFSAKIRCFFKVSSFDHLYLLCSRLNCYNHYNYSR